MGRFKHSPTAAMQLPLTNFVRTIQTSTNKRVLYIVNLSLRTAQFCVAPSGFVGICWNVVKKKASNFVIFAEMRLRLVYFASLP